VKHSGSLCMEAQRDGGWGGGGMMTRFHRDLKRNIAVAFVSECFDETFIFLHMEAFYLLFISMY